MYNQVSYEDILGGKNFVNPIFVDLRSESEHEKESIPGSITMPILNNEERRIVGRVYKNNNPQEAKKIGMEVVSKKLPDLYGTLLDLMDRGEVILYCSRGGYRSTVLFQLLKSLDHKIYKLDKGYKGYRAYITKTLEDRLNSYKYVNLNGLTGCGKTEILQELKTMANVLDFENLANHRGSIFGSVGLGSQPSQKMFESLIFEATRTFEGDLVFVESESIKIGDLQIFKSVHDTYISSPNQVLVTASMEDRVKRIREDYLQGDLKILDQELNLAIDKMWKYVPKEARQKLKDLVEERDYDRLIEDLMVKYYDKKYKRENEEFELIVENKDSKKAAQEIYAYYIKEKAKIMAK